MAVEDWQRQEVAAYVKDLRREIANSDDEAGKEDQWAAWKETQRKGERRHTNESIEN